MDLSHGCIRLATENALYIYNNIPSGTGIWIE
ncbi:MAG TPA: L,D-transpeptidase family protein [Clostridiaceae bacterium]|nr:L,D-transpeptidase family protein [Clostridiaceae bacterium]